MNRVRFILNKVLYAVLASVMLALLLASTRL